MEDMEELLTYCRIVLRITFNSTRNFCACLISFARDPAPVLWIASEVLCLEAFLVEPSITKAFHISDSSRIFRISRADVRLAAMISPNRSNHVKQNEKEFSHYVLIIFSLIACKDDLAKERLHELFSQR